MVAWRSVVDRPGYYIDFRLSANQSCPAFARVDPGGAASDLWVLDLARGNPSRLRSSSEMDATPIWSPDDSRLIFRSNRRSIHELFESLRGPRRISASSNRAWMGSGSWSGN